MHLPGFHRFALGLFALGVTACGNGDPPTLDLLGPVPQAQVQQAVDQLDALAADLMQRTGIPGMAVAVVQGDRVIYAKGFGVRAVGSSQPVDADTVFQLASVSKPVGATVVAQQVGAGRIQWDTPMRRQLPWFSLSDAYVSQYLTIADLYAHRSGLPDHAGDALEELGYGRDDILRRMVQLPLASFRTSYFYTNYGMTGAATAVAAAAGTDWATLSEQALYKPLGMNSTSSRFADFRARPNRAFGHVKQSGVFVVGPENGSASGQQWAAYDTDSQAPSGGVSSSANDMARWMAFVIGVASGTGGGPASTLVPRTALLPALTPKATIYEAKAPRETSLYYGYGFTIDTSAAGRTILSHNGAFAWGASTNFAVMPSAGVGIVVLTNAWPTGAAEALVAHFNEVVQFGAPTRDWYAAYAPSFAAAFKPQGALAGLPRPAQPVPPRQLDAYAGGYRNNYLGEAQVARGAQGGLELRIGARAQQVYALQHWDGDVFTFVPLNDSAPPGSLSKADFTGGKLVLEHYNHDGLGTFARVTP